MTQAEFIDELKNIMEIDELRPDQKLAELEEFDSLAVMGVVAMVFSKFHKKISGDAIKSAATAAELMKLVGMENFQ